MKLSEYAIREKVTYRTAWNRYKAGKIEGAYETMTGRIFVPDDIDVEIKDAAIYARVSDPKKRHDQLLTQQKRMEDWAIANGYRIVESVKEVGSGVNDNRRQLTSLLKRDTWGTLIVEHKDRLTRFGFNWFKLFIEQQGRSIVVVNEATDDTTDLINDLVAIIYSFSARLYGQRRSKRAKELVALATNPFVEVELDETEH